MSLGGFLRGQLHLSLFLPCQKSWALTWRLHQQTFQRTRRSLPSVCVRGGGGAGVCEGVLLSREANNYKQEDRNPR